MDGHQDHLVAAFVVAVDVADEGDVFKVAFQRGFLAVLVAVVFHVIDQLAQVLQPVGGVLVALGDLLFEHGLVPAQLNDVGRKFIQRPCFQRLLQFLVDLPEFQDRHDGAGQPRVLVGVADDLQHTRVLLRGKVCDDLDGRVADLPRRFVDDAAQADIVAGVGHDGHIGVDVLDLFAVVEALAAHDLVRDACAGEVAFDGGRLRVHPVEHRVVCQMPALFEVLTDDIRDVHGLILLVLRRVDLHLVALTVLRPEGLALALGVVLDDAVGGVEDIGGRAVVLLQTNGLCAGIDALKVEDVLDGGTAEPVDALVIVADDADVLFRPGEQADQAELCHAGVLVFVHEQIAVFVLVELPHLLVPGQQLDGLVDEVIEIERTGVLQLLFVGRIDLGRQRPLRIPRRGAQGLFGADELVFPAAHLVDGALDRKEFVVDAQLFVHAFHHALGVVGIIDGKAAGVADLLRPAAQDAHTGRVEGGGEHLVTLFAAQHVPQALLQLPCRLVRKGDRHHVPAAHRILAEHPVQPGRGIGVRHDSHPQRLDVVLGHFAGHPLGAVRRTKADEVRDAVDQHGRLAASGACQDQQRAVGGKHSLPLHRVQAAELFFNVGIAQRAKFLPEINCHCFTCSLSYFP